MDIHFREYKNEDKGLLLDLTRKLAEFVKSLDSLNRIKNLPGFLEASLEETLKNIENHQGRIWFMEDKEKIVGYIIGVIWEQSEMNKLEIGPHTLGEILDIYLEKEYRGKDIGKTMLQQMQDYFKKKGCDSMWIGVFASNKNAYSTYRKFGFGEREIGMLKQI